MRQINLSRDAEKFLPRLPLKHGRQIAQALLRLQEDPAPHDSQPLRGYSFLRLDVGEYRIIYEITSDFINVLLIGKRNDGEIYKKLKRK